MKQSTTATNVTEREFEDFLRDYPSTTIQYTSMSNGELKVHDWGTGMEIARYDGTNYWIYEYEYFDEQPTGDVSVEDYQYDFD